MPYLNVIDSIDAWRQILIDGDADRLDSMFEEIEKRFKEKGWERDVARESSMNGLSRRPARWRCFAGGPKGGTCLMLGLNRVSDRRVSGGAYSLLGWPANLQAMDVPNLVEEVKDEVLTPSASQFGLEVRFPRFGPSSRVPAAVIEALRLFSEEASGDWPLKAEHEPAWRRFVIQACREDTAFDIFELNQWFRDYGWDHEDAEALTGRFISDSTLVEEYENELRA